VSGWWLVSYVVLWGLVVILVALVVALARQVGVLHLRLGPRGALEADDEGPPLGQAPPATSVADLTGTSVTVGGPGEPQLVLFVSPSCPICHEVLPGLRPAARMGGLAPIVVVDAEVADADPYRGRDVGAPVVAAPELASAYDVPGTPYLVALDHLGVVRAKGTVNNLEQMEGLVDTARRRAGAAATAPGA
jgi:methylamine dehydrogenase accessory protein MauD